ncbi:SLAP domain-containing protein [Companilactobacillus keshanensis]|uniref:SLAP domain-containing protein n=1 Tax=Companilactobacillus keshanensis TaxID=2486003 RepID=A0ABW4BTV6_9LACO|nr:SLAP domain-containing protein [Companilactobacillus keshanensis]
MRNKIKYAGITAVVLLTAAPMITSSLNSTTIKGSSVVDANVSNVNNSRVDVSEIQSADLQYPTEITVEEGSLVSNIDNNFSGYQLVSSEEGSKGTLIGTAKNVETGTLYDGKEYYSDPDLKNGIELGDTFTSEHSTLYRYVVIQFDDLAGNFLERISNGGAGGIYEGLTVNNSDQDLSIYLVSDSAMDKQKINVVPPTPVTPPVETPKEISGVAIVNHDNSFYHLYNENNEQIDHRALSANSHWQVDQVRTIDGEKQYRVSTNEWIKAENVSFIENAEVAHELTITPLSETQQIDLSDGSHHKLYNSDLEVSDVRALSGGTSWIVDKIGRDAHGGVYYGVSNNEFVKAGDGVTLIK